MDKKEMLKKDVEEFLSQQTNYDHLESLKVVRDEEAYFILYGDNFQSSVTGFGKTPNEAFEDFKVNW